MWLTRCSRCCALSTACRPTFQGGRAGGGTYRWLATNSSTASTCGTRWRPYPPARHRPPELLPCAAGRRLSVTPSQLERPVVDLLPMGTSPLVPARQVGPLWPTFDLGVGLEDELRGSGDVDGCLEAHATYGTGAAGLRREHALLDGHRRLTNGPQPDGLARSMLLRRTSRPSGT